MKDGIPTVPLRIGTDPDIQSWKLWEETKCS